MHDAFQKLHPTFQLFCDQGARGLMERYPITTYVKICVVLLFLNASVYLVAAVGLCALAHICGAFDTFLDRFYRWCEQAGFTQRRPFSEVSAWSSSKRVFFLKF